MSYWEKCNAYSFLDKMLTRELLQPADTVKDFQIPVYGREADMRTFIIAGNIFINDNNKTISSPISSTSTISRTKSTRVFPGISSSSYPPNISSRTATTGMKISTSGEDIWKTISSPNTMRTTPSTSTISRTKFPSVSPGCVSSQAATADRRVFIFAENIFVNNNDVTVPAADLYQRDAEQFTEKFFTQLNQLHPSQPAGSTSDWGPNYFMADATLNVRELEGLQTRYFFYTGSIEIASKLGNLVRNQGFRFYPNLSKEGTRGQRYPHGVVLIDVCGTIQEGRRFFGIFEQQFELVKDPLGGNIWKIQFIKMKTDIGSSQIVPTLSDIFSFY